MTAAPTRDVVDGDPSACGVVGDIGPGSGVTLGQWLTQLDLEVGEVAQAFPHQVEGEGPSPGERQRTLAGEPPEPAGSEPVEAPLADPAGPVPLEMAGRLHELEDAMETAVSGIWTELTSVQEELAALGSETRDAVAVAMGRLARQIERAEALSAKAHRSLQDAFGDLDRRLRTAETQLDSMAAYRGLGQLVEDLGSRLNALENAPAKDVRSYHVGKDLDDLFERDDRASSGTGGRDMAAERRCDEVRAGHGRVSSLARERRRWA